MAGLELRCVASHGLPTIFGTVWAAPAHCRAVVVVVSFAGKILPLRFRGIAGAIVDLGGLRVFAVASFLASLKCTHFNFLSRFPLLLKLLHKDCSDIWRQGSALCCQPARRVASAPLPWRRGKLHTQPA